MHYFLMELGDFLKFQFKSSVSKSVKWSMMETMNAQVSKSKLVNNFTEMK